MANKKNGNQIGSILIAIPITLLVIAFVVIYILANQKPAPIPPGNISNFNDCVSGGYKVGESSPRQCWTPDGKRFVEVLKQEPTAKSSPITISGEITCLPKKGPGPQTLECATGLKASDGNYYGLKNLYKLDPEYKFSAGGLKVEVSGIFIQEESSGPDGNGYDIVGTIDVSSISRL